MSESQDLVIVQTYTSEAEAHMAKALLEQHDILAFIHDTHLQRINPFYGAISSGIKLRVRASDLAQATQVLAKVNSGHLTLVEGQEPPPSDLKAPNPNLPVVYLMLFIVICTLIIHFFSQ